MYLKNIRHRSTLYLTLGFCLIVLFLGGISTLNAEEAVKYVPLVGLPGLTESGATSIPEYINNVYLLLIVIGSLLGVMRIAWAGVKYSLSDVVTDKHDAKHDIQGVLLGLAILLIPFIVLREINPDLVKLDVLSEASKHKIELKESSNKNSQTNTGSQNLPNGTVLNGTGDVRDIGDITLQENRGLESSADCPRTPQSAAACATWCSNFSGGAVFSKSGARAAKNYVCRYHDEYTYPTYQR